MCSRGVPGKTPLRVRKIHVFCQGSPGKSLIAGLNITLLGSLQTVDMKNNPQ